ncbi:sentrin-specific protease 1 isoform X2 [Condylostylus longicornis]|uniref:sentrin-specific protease 1 isoform X2 n=1 Tax=Condylostylus longicornis TaxID=2530218 RepID=UPI00244E1452|nr:sentrin-specific protease 1 isoform X2 [Condylostylus longicornis]
MKLDILNRQKENVHGEMDFISRIFKLIRGNTEPNSLKRRSEEKPDYSQLTKYRRVTNEFPKIIERPFEDDIQTVNAPPNVSVPLMSQQKRKLNERSSILFPMSKSNNFAELEYSDDEDEILQPRRPLNKNSFDSGLLQRGPEVVDISKYNLEPASKFNEISSQYKANQKTLGPFTQNIPVRVEAVARSQVPPLIEPRTGNIITSLPLNVPDLKPIRKSFFSNIINTLGNSVSNNTPTTSNLLNGNAIVVNNVISQAQNQQTNLSRSTSINCMNGSLGLVPKIPAFRKQDAKNVAHSSYMINTPNTVVNQVYNIQEKESYEELLKKLVPSLYNSDKRWCLNPENNSLTIAENKKVRKGIRGRKPIHDFNHPIVDRIDLTSKGVKQPASSKLIMPVINLDEDDDNNDKGVIDLDAEETTILSQYRKLGTHTKFDEPNKKNVKDKKDELPYVEPVNTLKEKNELSPVLQPQWLTQFQEKFALKQKLRQQQISEATEDTTSIQLNRARKSSEETERAQRLVNEKFKNFHITADIIIIDEEEEEEEVEFPEFSDEDDALIKKSIYRGTADEVLIQKFNMSIRRRDIQTLVGDTWLNDEVINFYMNLLMERGEIRASENYPKVYAMNTFFIPRLMSSGYSAVRRWTRKVDLFSYDIIPVPVHVGGVHWCMAIIHLKNKTIKYYDSMGTPNLRVLQALEQYLRDESLDKKNVVFETNDFVKECVADCPRQMNGSDCGVFSCMFAEYVTRNKSITFSQQHMQYFRHKMILEIVKGKLLL